jgi:hypothetical protein
MSNKKVILYDEHLFIGKKRISWDQIIGIREINDNILQKISNRFPRAELFLKGGKIITLSKLNKFQNKSSFSEDQRDNDYNAFMKIVRDRAKNLNPIFSHWIEWRLISPIVAFEIFTFLISIILMKSFPLTIIIMLLVGILGAIIGFLWERNARKKILLNAKD